MKKQVELSQRMQAAADMVTTGNRVCDVGCDHGYVSIYLVQSKKAPHVLAMDVNKGPLMRGEAHVEQFGVKDYITLRLSDGLSAYQKGEADTMLAAGMGGRLLMEILDREPEKTADFKELVLQPQSELPLFRKYLREKGYRIAEEKMVLEDGKFYPMMRAVPSLEEKGCQAVRQEKETAGGQNDDITLAMEDMLGPLLLQERNSVLLLFIRQEIRVKESILSELSKGATGDKIESRKKELSEELFLLKKAEALYGEAGENNYRKEA